MKRNATVTEIKAFQSGDGAHCGLADWYPEKEKALRRAALSLRPFTTGWYGSKKEIASARISRNEKGEYLIEVSVSDDFDTEGKGQERFTFQGRGDALLERIQKAIYKAWDAANADQRSNRVYTGFKVLKKGAWVETYIRNESDFLEQPPGDNYHKWGWQNDCSIPKKVREKLEDWAIAWRGNDQLTVGGYTIQPWGN